MDRSSHLQQTASEVCVLTCIYTKLLYIHRPSAHMCPGPPFSPLLFLISKSTNPLSSPNLPPLPHRREHEPRMRNRKTNTRQRNHPPIKHQKCLLLSHPRIPPTARHLRNTINTSNQNRTKRDPYRPTEESESLRRLCVCIV